MRVKDLDKEKLCIPVAASGESTKESPLQPCGDFVTGSALGRKCNSCGKEKNWNGFDKKPNGRSGHDSRCKACIAKIKSERTRLKNRRLKREERATSTFKSVIVGTLDETSIDRFSATLCNSLMELIEDGRF